MRIWDWLREASGISRCKRSQSFILSVLNALNVLRTPRMQTRTPELNKEPLVKPILATSTFFFPLLQVGSCPTSPGNLEHILQAVWDRGVGFFILTPSSQSWNEGPRKQPAQRSCALRKQWGVWSALWQDGGHAMPLELHPKWSRKVDFKCWLPRNALKVIPGHQQGRKRQVSISNTPWPDPLSSLRDSEGLMAVQPPGRCF